MFATDVLVCDTCGGAMGILAILPEGDASRTVLAHLGLRIEPPPPRTVEVTHRPDARSPSGRCTTLDLVLARLPRALVPAAALLLARLPDLLAAWSGDEPPEVHVRTKDDEAGLTATYRSEAMT